MWSPDDIAIEVDQLSEQDEVILIVTCPAGRLEIIGSVSFRDSVLLVSGVHVQGLSPGALNRAGLNAIGRKLLEYANVQQVIFEGGTRTTGLRRGRTPRRIVFPGHEGHADSG